jgi:hypothetical protein
MAPEIAEDPYNDRQTKLRLQRLEEQGNGADLSTVHDIIDKRP